MKFGFRRWSEFDDLLKPRRTFPGWAAGILVFVLVIALVWFLFFQRVADTPPAPVAPEPAAASPSETLPLNPQKVKAAAKQSDNPDAPRQPEKPDGNAGDEEQIGVRR
jgi:hypothetical protein